MRIRKNAKISDFIYPNTNLSNEGLHTNNVCQLNQSPWDIITCSSSDSFPSVHQFDNYEVHYNVNYAGNGSSADSIGDFKSVALKSSRSGQTVRKNNYRKTLGFKKERKTNKTREEIKLCDKLDDKGWQCGNVVKNCNTMCDYHLSELQKYAVWTTKEKSGPASGPTGGRPHRSKKRVMTNPHEYYYYTGFGPSWGNKRGTVAATIGIDDHMDVQEENGKRFKPEISEVGPMELDYFDDNEDDDEKGKIGITGKKRGRKPVKERSLKSLM